MARGGGTSCREGSRRGRAPGAAAAGLRPSPGEPGLAGCQPATRRAGGSVYLRPHRKPSPGAVPRLPHYVSGREAGTGRARGHGAPPPGREPAAVLRCAVGQPIAAGGERSVSPRQPGCGGLGTLRRRSALLGGVVCVCVCVCVLCVSALD